MGTQTALCQNCGKSFIYADNMMNGQPLENPRCFNCMFPDRTTSLFQPCKCGKTYKQLGENLTGLDLDRHVEECNSKWQHDDLDSYPKKGKKNDQEKPDLSLIPREAMWEMGKALTYGAKKYGRYNFREGIDITRCTSAAMRHITQFLDGEDIDEETQCIHLGNAMAGLAMALWMFKNKPEHDDRWRKK